MNYRFTRINARPVNRFRTFVALATMAAAGTLSACAVPQTMVVGEVAKAAFEERKTEEQIVDLKIKAGIIERLAEIDKTMAIDLSVDVWKRKVMLTGALSDPKARNAAVRATQLDDRVADFYNDVLVVSETEQVQRREWYEKAKNTGSAAGTVVNDLWIETKISAQLLAAEGVSSVNFRWRSVLGNVYVLGEASTATELKKVLSIIGATKGVKSTKSHAYVSSK